jgi:hypothetical protein
VKTGVALNRKQEQFLSALIANGGKIAEAGRAAGYSNGSAYNLLRKPEIKAERERRLAELAEKSSLKAEEVVSELASMVRFDPTGFFYDKGPKKGQLKPLGEMTREQLLYLKSYKEDRYGCITITFQDRIAIVTTALDYLGIRQPAGAENNDEFNRALGELHRRVLEEPKPLQIEEKIMDAEVIDNG